MSARDRLDEIAEMVLPYTEHNIWHSRATECSPRTVAAMLAALRAVLELHYEVVLDGVTRSTYCAVCGHWPCSTVKAIEEALR